MNIISPELGRRFEREHHQ